MADTPNMRVDEKTREAERHDAHAEPSGGPQPTSDEEAAAERAAPADPQVSGNYAEYLELGAEQEGEGRMDVADDGRPLRVP